MLESSLALELEEPPGVADVCLSVMVEVSAGWDRTVTEGEVLSAMEVADKEESFIDARVLEVSSGLLTVGCQNTHLWRTKVSWRRPTPSFKGKSRQWRIKHDHVARFGARHDARAICWAVLAAHYDDYRQIMRREASQVTASIMTDGRDSNMIDRRKSSKLGRKRQPPAVRRKLPFGKSSFEHQQYFPAPSCYLSPWLR